MQTFAATLSTALLAIFLQNSIFERALGVNVLMYAARSRERVWWLSVMITTISTLASGGIFLADKMLSGWEYYSITIPVIYILIVSVIYLLGLVAVWVFLPKLFRKLRAYVHLSVFNCSVIGALFLESQSGGELGAYLGYGLGTGIGFLLAGYLIYTAHERLSSELVPAAFRGIPIMLVYVGILALALYNFVGYSTSL